MRKQRITHQERLDTLCFVLAGVMVFGYFWYNREDTQNTHLIVRISLGAFFTLIVYTIIEVFVTFLDSGCQSYSNAITQKKVDRAVQEAAETRKQINRERLAEVTFLDYAQNITQDPAKWLLQNFDDEF